MGNISPNLSVKDMNETLDFYTKKLGFMPGMTFPNPDTPVYADVTKDGMTFMFTPAAGAKEKMGAGVNFYLQIDGDIDSYYNDLLNRGVNVRVDIKNEPFGIRDFTIEDPDGYRLTFNAPVKAGGGSEAEAMGSKCLSCGMPMTSTSDFGGGKEENTYCTHCCHPDGSLKTYEEVLDGMITYMMTSQKLDRSAAGKAAREYLSIMPAWCEK
jgi:uncharacterized glyoxalase superfamily protein PhnB